MDAKRGVEEPPSTVERVREGAAGGLAGRRPDTRREDDRRGKRRESAPGHGRARECEGEGMRTKRKKSREPWSMRGNAKENGCERNGKSRA